MGRPSAPISGPRPPDDTANATSPTLIERIKADDMDAWRGLVARYGPFLRYWCRSWGVDRADVDDVLQEIFQAVHGGLNDFRRDREGDSFRGWLRGIARHKALSWHRRRGERGGGGTEFHRRLMMVPDPGGPPAPAEQDVDDHDVRGAYEEGLKVLRDEFEDRTWQAFWRAAIEGEATVVIAEDLGVTPAAVRQAKSRVLRRFKELLGGPLHAVAHARPGPVGKSPVTPRAIP